MEYKLFEELIEIIKDDLHDIFNSPCIGNDRRVYDVFASINDLKELVRKKGVRRDER